MLSVHYLGTLCFEYNYSELAGVLLVGGDIRVLLPLSGIFVSAPKCRDLVLEATDRPTTVHRLLRVHARAIFIMNHVLAKM